MFTISEKQYMSPVLHFSYRETRVGDSEAVWFDDEDKISVGAAKPVERNAARPSEADESWMRMV